MRYVDWDGKQASVLGFGCGSVMGRVGRRASLRAMEAAWEAGVTVFDVARSYGYGEAEALLGEFLQGKPESAVVVTKFGIWPEPQVAWKRLAKPVVRAGLRVFPGARRVVRRGLVGASTARQFSVAMLRVSLEESLRALRMESVDALLLHEAPASVMEQEDLMAELELVVKEGKARRVGVASTGGDVVEGMLARGPGVLRVFQFPSNLHNPGLKAAGRDGAWTMVNHPFGGEERVRAGLAVIAEMAADAGVAPVLREKLRGDARERLAEVVFGEVMGFTGADVVVPSMLRLEHLRANLAAIGLVRFSERERAAVRKRIVAGAGSAPRV